MIKHENAKTSDFSNTTPTAGTGGWSLYDRAGYNLKYEMGFTENESDPSFALSLFDIKEVSPGEYVAVGQSNAWGYDPAYFVKLSSDVEEGGDGYVHPKIVSAWQYKEPGTSYGTLFEAVEKDGENEYVIYGSDASDSGLGSKFFIMKVHLPDQKGGVIGEDNIIWKKDLEEAVTDEIAFAKPTLLKIQDGQYVIGYNAMKEDEWGEELQNARLAKLVENEDKTGVEKHWDVSAGEKVGSISAITQGIEGEYVVVGTTEYGSMVTGKYREITENGVKNLENVWLKSVETETGTILNEGGAAAGVAVAKTDDGGYLVGGRAMMDREGAFGLGNRWKSLTGGKCEYSEGWYFNFAGLIVKYDADGNKVWRGSTKYPITALESLGDGQYVAGEQGLIRFKDTEAYKINYHFISEDNPRLQDISGMDREMIFWDEEIDINTSATGWTFSGWHDNDGLTGAEITQITGTGEVNLYGEWARNSHTITFHVSDPKPGGWTWENEQTLTYGDYIPYPEVVPGWTFDGWYVDEGFANKFDAGTVIAEDTELWGRWTESEDTRAPKIRFVIDGYTGLWGYDACGFAYDGSYTEEDEYGEDSICYIDSNPQVLGYGEKAEMVEKGDYKNFKFNGWYEDSKLTKPFSFDRPITEDITVYGEYVDKTLSVTPYGLMGESDGSAIWDWDVGTTNTLTLENYNGSNIIMMPGFEAMDLVINLKGNNIINADNIYDDVPGILSLGPTEFRGDGSLEFSQAAISAEGKHDCTVLSMGEIPEEFWDEEEDWAVNEFSDVIFSQTGTVQIGSEGDEAINSVCGKVVEVNNGTLAVNATGRGISATEAVEMNGGEANIVIKESTQEKRAGILSSILVMNDGKLMINAGATGVLAPGAIAIRGGELHVSTNLENPAGSDYGAGLYNGGLVSQEVAFEGGKTIIDSNQIGLSVLQDFTVDGVDVASAETKGRYGITERENPLVFWGGDTTLHGDNFAVMVKNSAQKSAFAGREYMGVEVDSGLTVEPEDASFSTIKDEVAFEAAGDEDLVEYKTLLANADLEEIITHNQENPDLIDYLAYTGAVKSGHIYLLGANDSPGGEENGPGGEENSEEKQDSANPNEQIDVPKTGKDAVSESRLESSLFTVMICVFALGLTRFALRKSKSHQ